MGCRGNGTGLNGTFACRRQSRPRAPGRSQNAAPGLLPLSPSLGHRAPAGGSYRPGPPAPGAAPGAAGEGPAAALEHPPPAPGAGAPAARSTPGPGRAATGGLAAPLPAAPAPPGAARWAGCCRASSPPSPPLRRGRRPRLRQESGWRSGRARGAAAAPGPLPSPPGGRSGRARTGAAPAAGPPGAVVRARPAAPARNTETRRHGVKLHLFLK